jgi:aspartate 1-decarboxylase
MSKIKLMHAKLHRVRVTEANIEYVGSITIDRNLIEKVGILPLEEVNIWNVTNGNRLSTYVLPGEPGSGVICVNGAAARLCDAGDTLIIVAYEERDRDEVLREGHGARVIISDENNRVRDYMRQQLIPAGDTVQLHTLSNKVGLE